MLQFLYPLWLLGLPLTAFPWLWPVLQHRIQRPILFGAFFLLPAESLRQQFRPSRQEWPLKLIRSLLILLILLLLAHPFWREQRVVQDVWVLDDSASQPAGTTLPLQVGTSGKALRLTELFSEQPLSGEFMPLEVNVSHPGSPSLAEIATAVQQRVQEETSMELRVHLISDFQRSQYRFYPSAIQPLQWVLERPQAPVRRNLSIRGLSLRTEGFRTSWLEGELFGELLSDTKVRLRVVQGASELAAGEAVWMQGPLGFSLKLDPSFQRSLPVEVQLEASGDELGADNRRVFLRDRARTPWVGLVNFEGEAGIFQYGLHALRSALNANRTYAFLLSEPTPEDAVDLLVLLGDHPVRAERFAGFPLRIFIPTRLGDWREWSTQRLQEPPEPQSEASLLKLPPEQWRVDWSQTPLAEEWQIVRTGNGLFYSKVKKLWLLETGVGEEWGPLYQEQRFADEVQALLEQVLREHPVRLAGTFESGSPRLRELAGLRATTLKPGVYTVRGQPSALDSEEVERQVRFAVNLPARESDLALMSEEELEKMQEHLSSANRILSPESRSASNDLRDWLLWVALALACVELLMAFRRLMRNIV